jgi:hypothetical protein
MSAPHVRNRNAALPETFTVADVAETLHESEHYVKTKCRRREWPHRKGARGVPFFTAADVAEIVELCAAPAEAETQERFALAPRSRRGAA